MSKMKEKEILFIRHAESIANIGMRTKDISSVPLSEKGEKQAIELVNNIKLIPELIVLSPYIRTHQTAAPLIEKTNAIVEIWDEVKEFTYLDKVKYANTTPDERNEATKKYWEMLDPNYIDAEEESFSNLLERAEKTLDKLSTIKEKKIILFSHGQFLLAIRMLLRSSKEEGWQRNIMSNFWKEHHDFPIRNTQFFTINELIKCRTRKLITPSDLNGGNTLYGGTLMSWVDQEAAIFAMCQLETKNVVTKIVSFNFISPARQMDIIEIGVEVVKFGETSITLHVIVRNKDTEQIICEIPNMVFVSVDEQGKKKPHGKTVAKED